MQVGAGDPAGGAGRADGFAFFYCLAGAYIGARKVHVGRDESLAVVDENGVAVEKLIADVGDDTIGRGGDRRAGADGDIEAGVRVARQAVEDAAQAEA